MKLQLGADFTPDFSCSISEIGLFSGHKKLV